MSRNRLSRQQMLGLILTALLGAVAVVIVMLWPRPRASADPVLRRPDSIAAPAVKRTKETRVSRPAPPPAPRRHLDEPF